MRLRSETIGLLKFMQLDGAPISAQALSIVLGMHVVSLRRRLVQLRTARYLNAEERYVYTKSGNRVRPAQYFWVNTNGARAIRDRPDVPVIKPKQILLNSVFVLAQFVS